MNSKIRGFLKEAVDDVSLPKEPTSAANVSGEPMSNNDFPPAPAPEQASAGGSGLSTPQMPGQLGNSKNTIQKNVINPASVEAAIGPLKSYLSSFPKLFDNGLTAEDAIPHINAFLAILESCANSLTSLAGGGEPEVAAPELPEQSPISPEATATPEAPAPTPEPPSGLPDSNTPLSGNEGPDYTDPFGHSEESPYTNPLEAV